MSKAFEVGKNINGYVPGIDGLRAFAITLVLLSHVIHTHVPDWVQMLFGTWQPGTVGVRLFFLISGFLITHILKREYDKTGQVDIRRFFIRRVLRIFPAFYVYLIVLSILSSLNVIVIDRFAIIYALFYVQNWNVFQNTDLFATSWLVKHSWSLSVEEQYYLIYPFLFARLLSFVQRRPIALMIFVSLAATFFRALNYSYPDVSRLVAGVFFMHCDFLFYGGVLAIALPTIQDLRQKLHPLRYLLLIIALSTLVFASRIEYYSVIHIAVCGNLTLVANFYILLFCLLYPDSVLGTFLENRVVKIVGMLSYSLYVWQQLFLGSESYWLKFSFLTVFPYNLGMVVLCAAGSYLFIERPFLRLKRAYETR